MSSADNTIQAIGIGMANKYDGKLWSFSNRKYVVPAQLSDADLRFMADCKAWDTGYSEEGEAARTEAKRRGLVKQ